MNPIACNYNALATSPSSCTYANIGYDCNGNCQDDEDSDGVCDEFEIEGCQDPSAYNYDYSATDIGDCDYLGCTDENYIEYLSQATIDDGSCIELIVYGCVDSYADNYNPAANISDETCTFESITEPYIEVLFNSNFPSDAYLAGEDIFIEYIFHGGDENVVVGYPAAGSDAIIRWEIDGEPQNALFAPFAPGHSNSSDIFSNSFDFENGEHSIQFTLHSSQTGLPVWEPLVQTTINFFERRFHISI